jgi:hypothetical protein
MTNGAPQALASCRRELDMRTQKADRRNAEKATTGRKQGPKTKKKKTKKPENPSEGSKPKKMTQGKRQSCQGERTGLPAPKANEAITPKKGVTKGSKKDAKTAKVSSRQHVQAPSTRPRKRQHVKATFYSSSLLHHCRHCRRCCYLLLLLLHQGYVLVGAFTVEEHRA